MLLVCRRSLNICDEHFVVNDLPLLIAFTDLFQFLAQKMIPILEQPPYSPDVAPADFFLFPRLKAAMKGERFADVNAIKNRVTAVLRSIPQEAVADSFQKLYERCQNVL
ncbi:uncharacterized protein [Periplaneta americana]|uniref:uncharacterized protein n=1 Tax=Periplaneta americana TaxID=6978 RepID=UPI0037E930E8